MGGIYRLTDRDYKSLLLKISRNEHYNLDRMGKYVGNIHLDVTDLDAEEAIYHLEEAL